MKSKRPLKDQSQDKLQIVINDSSCLIALWKVQLLHNMLQLPYRFTLALPVQRDEMLDIAEAEWRSLIVAGLDVIDLDGTQTADAFALKAHHAQLSATDCFSLALARSLPNAILLIGDAQLRVICEKSYRIVVHGVLWVTDELMRHGLLAPNRVLKCLVFCRNDPTVLLPATMLAARIRRLR